MRSALGFFRSTAREWARRRQGLDSDPLILVRRRVYILPTRQGVAFGLMLFAMLMGSMNYNNSLALALTFLLASLVLVAMHHCHRNLLETMVRFGGAEPVFAGQEARFDIVLASNSSRPRFGLRVGRDDFESHAVDLEPGASSTLTIPLPTRRRGPVGLDRFSVSTSFPLGMFRAWCWVYMDLETLVYPAPAPHGTVPLPERTDTGGAQDDAGGDADFAGLRNFRPGDSPRHVAWKAFAHQEELRVKQYAGTDVATHWFDWEGLHGLDVEGRLAQLCRWIVDAHEKGHAYGLRLPADSLEPNLGRAHRHRCLSALALF